MFKQWFLLVWISSNTVISSFIGFWPSTTNNTVQNDFEVYWNVPTFMCHKHGMYFEEVSSTFGMRQNYQDQFRGEQIFILYDPGYFPALIKDEKGNIMKRNGGVPQMGNLTEHLELFKKDLDEQVPNKLFDGVAVIDMESWRPIFRQNWASLDPYRKLSLKIERTNHPYMKDSAIKKEATKNFEYHAKKFMGETLEFAKTLRPSAKWGYYAYPYCFNFSPNNPNTDCDPDVREENDRLSWLFSSQAILFPSLYLGKKLNEKDRVNLIKGRVTEALRLAGKSRPRRKVMPYFWYKYQDFSDTFLSKEDVENGIGEIVNRGSDGLVIWGSSNDLDNKTKCQELRDYLNKVLGPVVHSIRENRRHPVQRVISDQNKNTTFLNNILESFSTKLLLWYHMITE